MHKSRVLLINPNRMKPVVAPLALDYLASALTQQKIAVRLLDLSFASEVKEEIRRAFTPEPVDVVGITVRNLDDSYFASRDFCLERIKEVVDIVKKHAPCPVVLGGVGFSISPTATLRYCKVDMGIWGEGELAFPMLVKALNTSSPLHEVPGLVYLHQGAYRMNPPRSIDLADVNLSSRSLVDNVRYFQEGGMVGFETKRGCDQTCAFCADPVAKGTSIRMRPPQEVAAELEGLLKRGITHFHTCDSEFNLPCAHAEAVCREIIKKKLGSRLQWYAYAAPPDFPEELARLMRKAGCVGINFGVDSGSNRMLKSLGRRHTAEDLRAIAHRCRSHGFSFMFDLLLGGPGETKASIRQTLDLMKEINPSRVGISLGVRLYPGTRFGKTLAKRMTTSPEGFFGTLDEGMLRPLYFLSPALGNDIVSYVKKLIDQDPRFFFGSSEDIGENYNYNDNSHLVQALKQGYKGAFWDILRRVEEQGKRST